MSGLFSDAVQAARALHDQGLMRRTIRAGAEPEVTPRDFVVELPWNMSHGHAYGTPEEFIAYLRTVNHIPAEAAEEVEEVHDLGRQPGIRYRVVWRWWEVTAPLLKDLR